MYGYCPYIWYWGYVAVCGPPSETTKDDGFVIMACGAVAMGAADAEAAAVGPGAVAAAVVVAAGATVSGVDVEAAANGAGVAATLDLAVGGDVDGRGADGRAWAGAGTSVGTAEMTEATGGTC